MGLRVATATYHHKEGTDMPRSGAKAYVIPVKNGRAQSFNIAVIARNEFAVQGNLKRDELELLVEEATAVLKATKPERSSS